MQLTEQETNVIKDLQTQEKACVDKYRFYEKSANDQRLKDLFHRIAVVWRDTLLLSPILPGTIPKKKNTTNFFAPTPSLQKSWYPQPTMTMYSASLQRISAAFSTTSRQKNKTTLR